MILNKITIKRKILVIFICINFSIYTSGQEYNEDWAPKSPNVSELIKYISCPVDKSRGVVNLTVPIYTVKVDGYELPIRINYETSGIKVNQLASKVGLGWSINTGGFIARTIQGKCADEDVNGYLTSLSNVKKTKEKIEAIANSTYAMLGYSSCSSRNEEDPTWDTEPDLFYYNCGDVSGRFVHNSNGEILKIPENDIVIDNSADGNLFNEWLITLSDATKFYFKECDKSNVTHLNISDDETCTFPYTDLPMISNWNIERIVSNKLDTISFSYLTSREEIKDKSYGNEVINYYDPLNKGSHTYRKPKIRRNEYNKILDEINTKYERIVFRYKFREDVDGTCYALNYISIYDKESDNLLKRVYFYTSYFQSNENSQYYDEDVPEYSFKRLRLDSVAFYNNGLRDNSYAFKYNSLDYNKITNSTLNSQDYYTPPRFSRATDYWGYYNGKNENTTLIPAFIVHQTITSGSTKIWNEGDSHSVDPILKKAFILDQVKYPAGGIAQFYYDSDSVSYSELDQDTEVETTEKRPGGGLVIRKIIYNPIYGEPIKTEYTYTTSHFLMGNPLWDANINVTNGIQQQSQGVCLYLDDDISWDCNIRQSTPLNACNSGVENCIFHGVVKEYHQDNGYIEYYYKGDAGYNNPQQFDDNLTYAMFSDGYPRCVIKPFVNENQCSRITYYNNNGDKVKRISNKYKTYYREVVDESDMYCVNMNSASIVTSYTPYSIFTGYSYQTSQEVIDYDEDETEISCLTNYNYDQFNYDYEDGNFIVVDASSIPINHLISSDYITNSQNKTVKTVYKYPTDLTYNDEMVDSNYISPIIEKTTLVDDSVVESHLVKYDLEDGMFLPTNYYSMESKRALSDFQFFDGNNMDDGYKETPDAAVIYNSDGKPIQVTDKNGITTSYIWGYNDRCLIAKIVNAEFDDIDDVDEIIGMTDEDELLASFEKLRNSEALTDAQVTGYTYDPTIGMTSQTDPAGHTTYYNYDSSNRLEYIRDQNLNVVKKYKYHYGLASTVDLSDYTGEIDEDNSGGSGDTENEDEDNTGDYILKFSGYNYDDSNSTDGNNIYWYTKFNLTNNTDNDISDSTYSVTCTYKYSIIPNGAMDEQLIEIYYGTIAGSGYLSKSSIKDEDGNQIYFTTNTGEETVNGSFTITGLKCSTDYYYIVRFYKEDGSDSASELYIETTLASAELSNGTSVTISVEGDDNVVEFSY